MYVVCSVETSMGYIHYISKNFYGSVLKLSIDLNFSYSQGLSNNYSFKFFSLSSEIENQSERPYKCIFKIYLFLIERYIALQYCAGFCHTSTCISHKYTYAPSLLNLLSTSHPIPTLQVVTEPKFEFPEAYSKFPLAIYFTYCNVVSMLFSPYLPPSR